MSYRGRMLNGVAVPDVPANLPDGTPVQTDVGERESEFWQNQDVEALARDQRVPPVGSLDELAGDWPQEDSVDELISFVREGRS